LLQLLAETLGGCFHPEGSSWLASINFFYHEAAVPRAFGPSLLIEAEQQLQQFFGARCECCYEVSYLM